MKRVTTPTAAVRIRTGEGDENTALRAFDYGLVEYWTGTNWKLHPAFNPEGEVEFTIELLSNVVERCFQSHLMLYAGKMPFCVRAHRRDDGIGVAMRRTADGRRVPVECNPEECAWRRLHLAYGDSESTSIVKELNDLYAKEYTYISFLGKRYDKKKKEEVATAAMCLPANFLICALVDPKDPTRFVHGPSEFCLFHSKSDRTHGNIMSKLQNLWSACHGQLKGYRMKLVYRPFPNRFGKKSPAWDLEDDGDSDIAKQQIEAAQRRQLRALNYDEIVSSVNPTALALIDQQRSLAIFTQQTGIQLANLVRGEIDDSRDSESVAAEYVDPKSVSLCNQDPVVIRMCERVNLSYPARVKLAMKYGGDVYRAMNYLHDWSEKIDVYTGDIWADFTSSLPGYVSQTAIAQAAPAITARDSGSAAPNTNEPIDAEFTDVTADERTDEQLMAAVTGSPMTDAEKRGIEAKEREEAERELKYQAELLERGLTGEARQGRLLE